MSNQVTLDELSNKVETLRERVEDDFTSHNNQLALLQNIVVYLRKDLTRLENTTSGLIFCIILCLAAVLVLFYLRA